MLDFNLRDKIDSRHLQHPDHTFTPAGALRAMNMGQNTSICQKTLTWVDQRKPRDAKPPKRAAFVTQMGNQGPAKRTSRAVAGDPQRVLIAMSPKLHIFLNRPVCPGRRFVRENRSGPRFRSNLGFLDRSRPNCGRRLRLLSLVQLRGWVDFGTGALVTWHVHTTNHARHAFEIVWTRSPSPPVKNPASSRRRTVSASSSLMFEFPNAMAWCRVSFYWYDGGQSAPQKRFIPIAQVASSSGIGATTRRRPENGSACCHCRLAKRHLVLTGRLRRHSTTGAGRQICRLQAPEQTFARIPCQGQRRRTTTNGISVRHDQRWNTNPAQCRIFGYRRYAHRKRSSVGTSPCKPARPTDSVERERPDQPQNVSAVNEFVHREYRDGLEARL